MNLRLLQIAAEALDARARLFQRAGRRRVRDAERVADSERSTLHDRDALGFQKFGDEILVAGELLAGRRRLADRAGA